MLGPASAAPKAFWAVWQPAWTSGAATDAPPPTSEGRPHDPAIAATAELMMPCSGTPIAVAPVRWSTNVLQLPIGPRSTRPTELGDGQSAEQFRAVLDNCARERAACRAAREPHQDYRDALTEPSSGDGDLAESSVEGQRAVGADSGGKERPLAEGVHRRATEVRPERADHESRWELTGKRRPGGGGTAWPPRWDVRVHALGRRCKMSGQRWVAPRASLRGDRKNIHMHGRTRQRRCKLVEEPYSWWTVGGLCKLRHGSRVKTAAVFAFSCAACSLLRLRTSLAEPALP